MECDLFNAIISPSVGVIGTISGAILGWWLNQLSRDGKIYINNISIRFNSESDMHRIIGQSKEVIPGKVLTLTIKFNIISMAEYDKIIREVGLRINKKKVDIVCFFYKYGEDEYLKKGINNSLLLKSKQYAECEITISRECIEALKKEKNKIQLTYINESNRKEKRFMCNNKLKEELKRYITENGKV